MLRVLVKWVDEQPSLAYRGYRFPTEIISYRVWLYFRFSVSYRDIEELMAERGVTVTYETIRAWWSLGDSVCRSAKSN